MPDGVKGDGIYDRDRAMAYQTAVIHLAAASGLNVIEMIGALGPVLAVCKSVARTSLADASRAVESADFEPGER